jgi:hypothetical protein
MAIATASVGMTSIRGYGDQRQPSFNQAIYPGPGSDVQLASCRSKFWERPPFLGNAQMIWPSIRRNPHVERHISGIL